MALAYCRRLTIDRSMIRPNHFSEWARNACCYSSRLWFVPVVIGLVAIANSACWADDNLQANQAADVTPSAVNRARLSEIIAALRAEEARYQNYVATRRRAFIATETQRPLLVTTRQRVQGPLFNVRSDDAITLADGTSRNAWRLSIFDGQATISVEGENCITEYAGRVEPPDLIPPHCWGLIEFQVSFPLSVLLSGIEALKANPKVAWRQSDQSNRSGFRDVQVTSIEDELIDAMDCVKLRIKRWTFDSEQPRLMVVWLAKNRNWHVVRCQALKNENDKETALTELSARKWTKLAPDMWIPRLFDASLIQPNGDLKRYQRLVIESVQLQPDTPHEEFKGIEEPIGLPRFVVSENCQLTGSPYRPSPLNEESPATLASIFKRLGEEEQKYLSLDLKLTMRRSSLNLRESSLRGEIFESEERYVAQGEKQFVEATSTEVLSQPEKLGDQQHGRFEYDAFQQSNDGIAVRTFHAFCTRNEQINDASATMQFPKPAFRLSLRPPHSFLFEESTVRESLVQFLQSGWYDEHAGARMEITYEGDSRIEDLICHKLVCSLPKLLPTTPKSHFVVWLARDRNLLPIRREWYDERVHPTLPLTVAYATDLQEVKPGCWFPIQSTILKLERVRPDALNVNRVVLNSRIDWHVKNVTLDPMMDEDFFSEIHIPGGTKVDVIEPNRTFWEYIQKSDGPIEVATEPDVRGAQRTKIERDKLDQKIPE